MITGKNDCSVTRPGPRSRLALWQRLSKALAEKLEIGFAEHGFVVAGHKNHLHAALHKIIPAHGFVAAMKDSHIRGTE